MSFRALRTTGHLGALVLVIAAAPTTALGQLRGTVVASDARPVVNAYVSIRRAGAGADTAVAATARTDTTGVFQVRGLTPGPYLVRVRALGFAPFARVGAELASSKSDSASNGVPLPVDLGRITLTPLVTHLERVQVTEERDATVLAR